MIKKLFIATSLILYITFIIEAITGYYIEKPRIIGEIFGTTVDRRDAYILHSILLPIVLYTFILFHTSIGLRKYLFRSRWLIFVALNIALLIFLTYIHLL